jgi:hypothetical protein
MLKQVVVAAIVAVAVGVVAARPGIAAINLGGTVADTGSLHKNGDMVAVDEADVTRSLMR